MGLKLLKGRNGKYRRAWYAVMSINGKRTTRCLKTPLRGRIPLDESGTFSLDAQGDEAFEASKAAAREELKQENTGRREEGLRSRQHAESLGVRTIRLSDLATENAKRKKYELIEGSRNFKYNKSVFNILEHFAKWTAERPRKRNAKSYHLLADIDSALVKAYYADISARFAWQSFRKYAFILKSIFKHFTGGAITNPFETEYSDYKGKKSEFGDKAEIAHKPPSAEEMSRVWEYAASIKNKPYLRRLAVVASCTGLRMGDCCNLEWSKIDLQAGQISPVKTLKTGAEVAVPIFDYDPESLDYNPVFGELRRELEAALAERKDGERFVIPEAARIYAYNPSRITEEGKTVFAHALAPKETVEEAVLIGEEKPQKTTAEILAAIDTAPWTEARRERVRTVYTLHTAGKSYRQIAEVIGKLKSSISEDLAAVEDLTGETLRRGTTPPGHYSHSHNAKLMKATRQKRGQGQRAACLYGWHSCRMFFVGYAYYELGMKEADLVGITGHKTVRMVRHYIETNGTAAVKAAKQANAERNLKRKQSKREIRPPAMLPPPPDAKALPTPQEIAEQRLANLKYLRGRDLIKQSDYDRIYQSIIDTL